MKKDSVAYSKSFKFAVRIVKLNQYLQGVKEEYTLSKQILKSGTSIGANLAEANGAISTADFSAKVSIAYKECLETKYWLQLLLETNYINNTEFNGLFEDADEIARILFTILKSTRINKK